MKHNQRMSTLGCMLACSLLIPAAFGQGTELQFYPISPCRLMDTRGLSAGFGTGGPPPTTAAIYGGFAPGQIASGGTLTLDVQSSFEQAVTGPAPCGTIPSTAQAYSFNITVVPNSGGAVDYVTLWAAGATRPYVATLSDSQGKIVSNAAIVPAGTSYGGVSIYNQGPSATDVIIDMNGYFAPPATGLQFYSISPCRLMDTRGLSANFGTGGNPATTAASDSFAPGQIASGGTLTLNVQSSAEQAITAPAPCGTIPSTAQAYSLNITVVPNSGGAVDYVSVWAAGATQPYVATLDDPQGAIVSNTAIVPAGTSYYDAGVSIYNRLCAGI